MKFAKVPKFCLEFVYKVNAQTTKSRKTASLKSRGLRVNRNIFLKYYLILSILGICRVKWKRKKKRFLFPSASNFRPKLGTPHWSRSKMKFVHKVYGGKKFVCEVYGEKLIIQKSIKITLMMQSLWISSRTILGWSSKYLPCLKSFRCS